jgi:hypothetical protein
VRAAVCFGVIQKPWTAVVQKAFSCLAIPHLRFPRPTGPKTRTRATRCNH